MNQTFSPRVSTGTSDRNGTLSSSSFHGLKTLAEKNDYTNFRSFCRIYEMKVVGDSPYQYFRYIR